MARVIPALSFLGPLRSWAPLALAIYLLPVYGPVSIFAATASPSTSSSTVTVPTDIHRSQIEIRALLYSPQLGNEFGNYPLLKINQVKTSGALTQYQISTSQCTIVMQTQFIASTGDSHIPSYAKWNSVISRGPGCVNR